jgi:hypothetical protein
MMKYIAAMTVIGLLQAAFPLTSHAEPLDKKTIEWLQGCLNGVGIDVGKPDGIAGQRTIEGIKEMQRWAKTNIKAFKSVEVTGAVDEDAKDICFGMTMSKSKVEQRKAVDHFMTGTLPVTSSVNGKKYPLTWEAKKVTLGWNVIYYFPFETVRTGELQYFNFEAPNIRYTCQNGVQEQRTPGGNFRKKGNTTFHTGVCVGSKGDLVSVAYAP